MDNGVHTCFQYDGSPSRENIYSGSTQIAKIAGSTTTYYHQDHLSNRLITNSIGGVIEQIGHLPYGESWYDTGSEKWVFTTYERDAESGNDYAQARYNVSRLGRFSSPDPLSGSIYDPQSLNRYSYTANDPINLVDPSGAFYSTAGLLRGDPEPEDPFGVQIISINIGASPIILEGEGGGGGGGMQNLLQTIANARLATYLALISDPNCLSFLGGDALSSLSNTPIVPTGYGGAGRLAATETIRSGSLSPNSYQINVNESGPFFTSGGLYVMTLGGKTLAGGSPRLQGFVLFHEVAHITGAIQPDGTPDRPDMAAEAKNNAAIASNCKNALSKLNNSAPPH